MPLLSWDPGPFSEALGTEGPSWANPGRMCQTGDYFSSVRRQELVTAPALGPGSGPRSPYVPFYGGISAPPHSLSQGQRTGGLHSHTVDLICFLFGLGSWFCLILHFFHMSFMTITNIVFRIIITRLLKRHPLSEMASPNSRRPECHTLARALGPSVFNASQPSTDLFYPVSPALSFEEVLLSWSQMLPATNAIFITVMEKYVT